MKASAWIDRAKSVRGWESDYRAAKELGVTRSTISKYRSSTATLDDEVAIRVATALGMNPAGIIIDQAAERQKSDAVRSALRDAAASLCILCKVSSAVLSRAADALPTLGIPLPGARFSRHRLGI